MYDALNNLIPFIQFKKREKHIRRNLIHLVTPNCARRLIYRLALSLLFQSSHWPYCNWCLENVVGRAFTCKPKGSRFDTWLRQRSIWVVQLGKFELYSLFMGAGIWFGAPPHQQISLVKRDRKGDWLPPCMADTDTKPLQLLTYHVRGHDVESCCQEVSQPAITW